MIRIITAATLAALAATAAGADPVDFTFTDMAFDNGGTVNGGFTYDADENLFSNVSVQTTAGFGPFTPGQSYIAVDPSSGADEIIFSAVSGFATFVFRTVDDLSNTSGFFATESGDEDPFFGADRSLLVQGGVTGVPTVAAAIPLPAGLPLLLAGLGGMAVLRRRKG